MTREATRLITKSPPDPRTRIAACPIVGMQLKLASVRKHVHASQAVRGVPFPPDRKKSNHSICITTADEVLYPKRRMSPS